MQSLHQAFAIHESNDDVPVPRTDAAIDDQDIAIEDLCPLHAVPLDGEEERADRIAH